MVHRLDATLYVVVELLDEHLQHPHLEAQHLTRLDVVLTVFFLKERVTNIQQVEM